MINSLLKYGVLVLISSIFVSLTIASDSNASYSGNCFFTESKTIGSRTIKGIGGNCSAVPKYRTNDVLVGRSSSGEGYALEKSNVNGEKKLEFVNHIINRFKGKSSAKLSGSDLDQDIIGAASIIQVVNGYTRWPTDDDVKRFKRLVLQDFIELEIPSDKVAVKGTSYFDSTNNNIFVTKDANDPENYRHVLRLRDKYSKKIYLEIELECGNFTSKSIPLLDGYWNVRPSVSVDKNEVKPGEAVTWTHSIQVDAEDGTGIGKASNNIGKWTDGRSGQTTGGSLPVGSVYGREHTFKDTRVFTTADVDKKFCKITIVSPGYGLGSTSWGDNNSDPECVTVIGETVPPSKCRPITVAAEESIYTARDNGQSMPNRVWVKEYRPKYKLSTDVYSDNTPYSSKTLWGDIKTLGTGDNVLNVTKKNTDGRKHDVILTDETNHVDRFEVKTHVYYNSIDIRTRKWNPETTTTTYIEDTTNPSGGEIVNTWLVGGVRHYRLKVTTIVPGSWTAWSGWSVHQSINRYDNEGIPGLPGNNESTEYRYSNQAPSYWHTIVWYSNKNSSGNHESRTIISGEAEAYHNSSQGTSKQISTVGPCFDYMLTTSISGINGNLVSGTNIGGQVSISNGYSYTSKNYKDFANLYKNPHSQSKATYWQVTKFVFEPGVTVPADALAGSSTKNPCAYYDTTRSSSCQVYQSGTDTVGAGKEFAPSISFDVPYQKAGTKICFAFSVRPDRSDPSNSVTTTDGGPWYHSSFNWKANCVMIVKKPKVQVWGGDLKVGKSLMGSALSVIDTSQSAKSDLTYGSWVEYGVFASAKVSGIGSASSLADGRSSGDTAACRLSNLTFSNTGKGNTTSCDASLLGNYKFSANTKDLSSYFNATKTIEGNQFSIDSSTSGVYNTKQGSIDVRGGTLTKSIVLNVPSSDVTISGNINYTTPTVNSLTDIPQMIIIAKNIYIRESVTNIDAWLIAPSGKINTCVEGGEDPAKLTVFKCDNLLTINGQVVAGKLHLRRTAGSNPENEIGSPAEIINLRSDAYLWMYGKSLGDNRLRTTYVVEVPPRL